MSEDDRDSDEYVILSRKPVDRGEIDSEKPVVVSGLALIVFTLIYMGLIIILPLGIILEAISNYVLDPRGLGVGFADRPFGLSELTAIYCAGLFLILSDVLRAGSKMLSQYVPENRLDHIMKSHPRIWGNLLIFVIIIPVVVVVVTTLAASQLSNPEDLWEIMMSGYTGAIIGAYRQIATHILPEY
ncbi:hypothetical protein [Halorubrum aidingense]|uniref:hypothetical protein n=1 Tax=Halorubrum aidingense TaxID=368623 RepID=UPI0012676ABE|nr:hypothetical protein [Halorubrum aidingense]